MPNAVVLNETPARIADALPEFFDRVLVDAPCSGEGMFRKEPVARQQHCEALVKQCAELGAEILDCAAAVLAPGDASSGKSAFAANCSGELRRADTVTPRSAVSCGAAYRTSNRSPSRARSRCSKYSMGILHSSCGMYKAAVCGQTRSLRGTPPRTENRKEIIHYGNRKPQQ